MHELSRHIGPDTDVPAGDIGVGGREVAYMFGAYKKIRNEFSGILTGKGFDFGGSRIRPEATGFGLVYYVTEMLRERGTDWKGKKVTISGSGNVAQYAALKVIELGGIVKTLSDSKGCLVAENGFTAELIERIAELKLKFGYLKDLGELDGYKYTAGAKPWQLVECDVALPSATQNEVDGDDARYLVKTGCLYVAEGSNMGSTQEAIDIFEGERQKSADAIWYAPGKAANCGGVAVSGLEMAQNSQRLQWSSEDVDAKLKDIMQNCYQTCLTTGSRFAKDGERPSLVVGANVAGFLKVAQAAKAQGDWWA